MQIAILVYDGFTALDAVGPYEVLGRLPGAEVVFVAEQAGPVRADSGALSLVAEASLADVPRPDLLLVSGGPGTERLLAPGPVHDWLREADAHTAWTASVCSGSLILAAAGLLTGRRATTHWMSTDTLGALGAVPSAERYVIDGKYATAAGVSAGIDLALHLAGRLAGDTVAKAIQLVIEYDPQPPYDSGSLDRADRKVVDVIRSGSQPLLYGDRR